MIEKALIYELKNNAAVAALVSTRIYVIGGVPTSAARPFVVLQRISNDFQQYQVAASSLSMVRIQIDSYADTQQDCWDVADAVRGALNRKTPGDWGSVGKTTEVKSCMIDDEHALAVAPEAGKQQAIFRVSQDYSLWYVP